jgi:hypothetical protein
MNYLTRTNEMQNSSALEEDRCIVGYNTFNFGEATSLHEVYEMKWGYSNMLFEAQFRDIQPPELCKKLLNQLPDPNWQADMIIWYTSLPDEEKDTINSYVSYGYEYMNESLRRNPKAYALINKSIEKAIPLPNDIIVYRYMSKEYLPEYGTFIHHGYLSTSYLASVVFRPSCQTEASSNILRLIVPKGTKCIYIPSRESELIFSHGSELQIDSKEQRTIICDNHRDKSKYKTITFYNAILISSYNA